MQARASSSPKQAFSGGGSKPRAKSLSLREALREARLREDARRELAIREARPEWGPLTRDRELALLTTEPRRARARRHFGKAREATALYREILDVWSHASPDGEFPIDSPAPDAIVEELRHVVATRRWHLHRAGGQLERFERINNCGAASFMTACASCRHESKLRPLGCGVRRVCDRCDTAGAMARRARFGRARGRVFVEGHRFGLNLRRRLGGRYTEKMLTLTVPHCTLADCYATGGDDAVITNARNDVEARIHALRAAWTRFIRKVNRHWKERREPHVSYHRAFEWTPGSDGAGHPHFHVYLWSPYLAWQFVREWWAEALREVGVPVRKTEDGKDVVSIHIGQLKGTNLQQARELLKGGRRQALTLSRVEYADGQAPRGRVPRGAGTSGGLDAFDYADGWTIGDVRGRIDVETEARLYEALEGKRLTQASRGFFIDDPPPECPCCGGNALRIHFLPTPDPITPTTSNDDVHERGPP